MTVRSGINAPSYERLALMAGAASWQADCPNRNRFRFPNATVSGGGMGLPTGAFRPVNPLIYCHLKKPHPGLFMRGFPQVSLRRATKKSKKIGAPAFLLCFLKFNRVLRWVILFRFTCPAWSFFVAHLCSHR